jgi:hypothetical protein
VNFLATQFHCSVLVRGIGQIRQTALLRHLFTSELQSSLTFAGQAILAENGGFQNLEFFNTISPNLPCCCKVAKDRFAGHWSFSIPVAFALSRVSDKPFKSAPTRSLSNL